MDADSEYLHALVGYVSLVYHEARNVRHLFNRVIEQDPLKLLCLPEINQGMESQFKTFAQKKRSHLKGSSHSI